MPRGKTKRSLDLLAACYDILAEIHPATVRAVCYQLFIRQLIASMAKTCTNRVSAQLVYAREQGLIPWDWIVDETREGRDRSAARATVGGELPSGTLSVVPRVPSSPMVHVSAGSPAISDRGISPVRF